MTQINFHADKKRSGKAIALKCLLATAILTLTSAGAAYAQSDQVIETESLEQLGNGLAWYALLMCITGLLISSALWAVGSKGQNAGQELTGKRGIIVCLTAAFFIGAAPGLINWLSGQAEKIDDVGVTSFDNNQPVSEPDGLSGDSYIPPNP